MPLFTYKAVDTSGKTVPTLYTLDRSDNSFLVDDRIPTPQDLNPLVPPALSNLVMECVASKPEKRPGGMDQVINRLEIAKHVLTKQQVQATGRP